MTTVGTRIAIEVRGLEYTYPDGQQALRGIDLSIGEGEKVALVGPNGAGKSTLLLHLNGILRSGCGEIRILGIPLNNGHVGTIRALVGLVFQDPDDQLFSPTVYDDVAFGPIYMGLSPKEVEERSMCALRQVGMEEFAGRIPHHLSAGEKRKIAIATVLSMNPEVLALDEPSAALDPRARRNLISLLGTLPQTMIIATHDMHFVRELFHRTVIMNSGCIATDGPTDVLLVDKALLEANGLELP
ncbi:energy-coupling factor ABC transporter ATP-binding protein [Chloroflexota bacterium]